MSFRQKTTALFTLGLALLSITFFLQTALPIGFTLPVILATSGPLVFSSLFLNQQESGQPVAAELKEEGKS
jgi:hypothetical protein